MLSLLRNAHLSGKVPSPKTLAAWRRDCGHLLRPAFPKASTCEELLVQRSVKHVHMMSGITPNDTHYERLVFPELSVETH